MLKIGDARLLPGFLSPDEQRALLSDIQKVLAKAPPFRPVMPKDGKPFSVQMSNCGPLGWVSDRAGYRYQKNHPVSGEAWPAMPDQLLQLWQKVTGYPHQPEACLINLYDEKAHMGLHRDGDEADRQAPVLSISLGDAALFRLGGLSRQGPTQSFKLHSGDILVLEGAARHAYHGIDKIYPGTSRLLPGGGRMNLTLRRVTLP